jgi:hypothetical protein
MADTVLQEQLDYRKVVLSVNRSRPFNPAELIGEGWTIEEQDERSLALTEVELSSLRFETCLKDGEQYITGEERLRRLKEAGQIRLDAKVFEALRQEQTVIIKSWTKRSEDISCLSFDGTVIRDPYGRRCVLCRCAWGWDYRWLGRDWDAHSVSALLTS